jgi:hypothetical protein
MRLVSYFLCVYTRMVLATGPEFEYSCARIFLFLHCNLRFAGKKHKRLALGFDQVTCRKRMEQLVPLHQSNKYARLIYQFICLVPKN